ncbi:MAG: HU family DNA-binding protein [Planctomycetaceae bacterium]|nr:HU family DNA-binding protein [Planctomycetaceae bacterium]
MAGTESAKPMTKSEIYAALAESTGLTRKDIAKVFEELSALVAKNLGKKGPGQFSLPGLAKMRAIRKPATKATTKANPFKPGEMMTVKAKAARTDVRIRPIKNLKEML